MTTDRFLDDGTWTHRVRCDLCPEDRSIRAPTLDMLRDELARFGWHHVTARPLDQPVSAHGCPLHTDTQIRLHLAHALADTIYHLR